MSLLLTFMELDKLYESSMSKQDLIDHIKKATGKNYKLDNRSIEQLLAMWRDIQKKAEVDAAMKEYHDLLDAEQNKKCSECGTTLSDGGLCPVCDDNEEDFLYEWLDASGNKIQSSSTPSTAASTVDSEEEATPLKTGTHIVTIVYDNTKHKLRAQADDGIHGIGNVAFPNDLRTKAGQQYGVETLIWNGKNYRVSGEIVPLT